MSLASGTICSISTKQKVNTQSSAEAEFIGLTTLYQRSFGLNFSLKLKVFKSKPI
jgi:hypothetical protein